MIHCVQAHENSFWNSIGILANRTGWMSPRHTASALHYYREQYEGSCTIEDCSFTINDGDTPLIAIIAQRLDSDAGKTLASFNNAMICIEDPELSHAKARSLCIEQFDLIAKQADNGIRFRDELPNGEMSFLSRHLLAYGASLDTTLNRVIDLKPDESDLKRNIRKRYKSFINWGNRELQPIVLDSEKLTWSEMDVFRNLHAEAAGRQTRTEESWRRQQSIVEAGEGFVVAGHIGDELVSAGMFFTSKHNCYYGSSASRRDLFEKPLFHSVLWKAILHAKAMGCTWFDVGEEIYPNQPAHPARSDKDVNISAFKTGFGGSTIPYLDIMLENMEQ
tara:strand:+ start:11530 stop:12531 length:1002 start_codon:yes stop_codon:yes gene_type:complete